MMFASFPVVSFNHQVTPRCFPTHVLKKTPFSCYCILSPVALSIRVFLREFSALVHEVAPREMLSVQGATEGGWFHEIFELQLIGENQQHRKCNLILKSQRKYALLLPHTFFFPRCFIIYCVTFQSFRFDQI